VEINNLTVSDDTVMFEAVKIDYQYLSTGPKPKLRTVYHCRARLSTLAIHGKDCKRVLLVSDFYPSFKANVGKTLGNDILLAVNEKLRKL